MRYLKMFEGYQSESEVAKICKRYGIKNWSLEVGLVNVDGNVSLYDKGLTELPLKFGRVTGYFDCGWNNLNSLVGCPSSVGGDFSCNGALNPFAIIKKWVLPSRSSNKITSLEGCPKYVGGHFFCRENNIKEFTGIKYIEGELLCSGNPIFNIWKIISPDGKWDEEHMDLFEDCSVIQDDGEAVAIDRLNFFLEEIGLEPVDGVDGYINI